MDKIKFSLKNLRDFFFEDDLSKFLSQNISSYLCVDIGAAKFEHIQWRTFLLSKHTESCIINAGDGAHEHPTQALLDSFSIFEKIGDLKGIELVFKQFLRVLDYQKSIF